MSIRFDQEFGDDVVTFVDVDGIPMGVDFRTEIRSKVSQCFVLLALIGEGWLAEDPHTGKPRIFATDDFVRMELEIALSRGIPIIPIKVDEAPLPGPDDWPDSLNKLQYINAAPLNEGSDFQHHLGKIVLRVREILEEKERRRKQFFSYMRRSIGLSVIFAAILLVAAGIWFFGPGSLATLGMSLHGKNGAENEPVPGTPGRADGRTLKPVSPPTPDDDGESQFDRENGIQVPSESEIETQTVLPALKLHKIPTASIFVGDDLSIVPVLKNKSVWKNAVTFSVAFDPPNKTFDQATGELDWTPSMPGTYEVSITAVAKKNETMTDTTSFKVVVCERPEFALNEIKFEEYNVGEPIEIALTMANPKYWNIDRVQFAAAPLPRGAMFDNVTGLIRWVPRKRGNFKWDISARSVDGKLADAQTIELAVSRYKREDLLSFVQDLDYWATSEPQRNQVLAQVRQNLERNPADKLSLVVRAAVRVKEAAATKENREAIIDEAVNDCTTVTTLDRQYALAYYIRGYARNQIGDYSYAARDLLKAVALEQSNSAYYVEYGGALFLDKQYRGALKEFESAVKCDPDNGHAYTWLALAKKELNRPFVADLELAVEKLGAAIDRKERLPASLLLRGHANRELGNYVEALRDHRDAFKIAPLCEVIRDAVVNGYANLARHLREDEDFKHAREVLKEGIQEFGWSEALRVAKLESYLFYAEDLRKHNQTKQALAVIEDGMDYFGQTHPQLCKVKAVIHHTIAYAAQRKGDNKLAKQELEKAVELNGSNFDALYHLATIHYELKEFNETANLLEAAKNKVPENKKKLKLSMLQTLRNAYLLLGELKRAEECKKEAEAIEKSRS